MSFGKPRYNKNYECELLRLCTKNGYAVVGGAEKLFSYFVKTHNPKSVISYCDLSKFMGNVYKNWALLCPPQQNLQNIGRMANTT